ncbi:MAG: hypothetical protein DWQ44_10625 [Bacteroidetes bacterium]|nr:MAG: hypothetical protein DWQ33_08745 [Bacteroidota bacterium]REK05090.1 MAG: hypothetical protein DWQ39_07755 [Bacteroidota bacterium]REK32496.1 MAG: hypothetical protein DWQ44_10625 [Bacteroidota bacterium]REK49057.1 MAG: hypothetical protein DWQ48_09335 [Bacteroidota bacterium]
MKLKKLPLILIIMCIVGYSCKTSKNNANTSVQVNENKEIFKDTAKELSTKEIDEDDKNLMGDTVRLVVSFFSVASGSDYKSMIAMEDSIGEFARRKNKTIDYQKNPWGREGEMDYCFSLSELEDENQAEFIQFIREVLKNAKSVNVYENQLCQRRRKL